MVDFRKKLLGLAGAAMVFSGMAYAQNTTCSTLTAPSGASFIRSEGQTELLPQLVLTCASVAGVMNLQIFVTPGVPITSKVLNSSTGATEAIAVANTGSSQQGTVIGSSVQFTGIVTTAGTTSITISNVRINATGIPSAPGQPPTAISVQAFVGGTNVTPGPNTGGNPTVAFASNGLGAVKYMNVGAQATNTPGTIGTGGFGGSTLGVCNSLSAQSSSTAPTPAFYVQVNEGFQSAFKSQGTFSPAAPPAINTLGTEQSQVQIAAAGSSAGNAANSGTRVKLAFSNVPGALGIYVPVTITSQTGVAVLTLTSSETGGPSSVPAIVGQSNIASLPGSALIPISGTSATAVYEITTPDPNTIDQFNIPVYEIAGGNSIGGTSATTQLTVSLAPITSAATVPSFGIGSASTAQNILAYSICQTSLLFPFVTNQGGVFETGISIANTTKDPNNQAKAQSGACVLNFYGQGGTNPTAVTAPNANEAGTGGVPAPYLTGETYVFTLSQALSQNGATPPAGGFGGYMIAQCNFQQAHGFAYIVYNPAGGNPAGGQLGGPAGTTMGYLALVLTRGNLSSGAEVLSH